MADRTHSHKHTHPEDLDDILDWFREHGVLTGIVIGAALIIVLGVLLYQSHQQSTERRASELLIQAQSLEDYQQVIDQYSRSSSAPMALLALASSHFAAGRYDLAQANYQQFIERYPEHALIASAELGRVYCLEAQGLWDEALEGYRAFAEKYAAHALAPLALFGQARAYAHLGRTEEAVTIYQTYIDGEEEANAAWRAQARTAMLYLEKDMRARKNAAP